MQTVSEVMTRDVRFVSPHENLQRAAQMMDELNVGVLPVCDGERLVGMVTDRDITVRGTAAGRAPGEAHVEEVMSTDVRWVFEDQPLDDVMRQMADTQIRRVPVVTHDDKHRLIGIVSLGDLATAQGANPTRIEHVVEEISTPSEPDRSARGMGGAGTAANAGASAVPRRDTSRASGSDTGTATGLAGSDMTDIGGGSGDPALAAENEDSAGLGSAARDAAESDSSGGLGDSKGTGTRGVAGTATAGGGIPGANANPEGKNEPGGDPGLQRTRKAGSTEAPAGAAGMGDTGGEDVNRNTAAPGGIDAAGPSGASGGTGGAAGTSGTGVGAKP
jgi:CBS domain-containing protein